MSIKNFKISTGLDLEGLILTAGEGDLLLNGSALATEQYVIDSLVGVDFDLSNNAGSYLDWNAGTSEFDVDIFGVAGALVSDAGSNSAYLVNVANTTMLDVNISALVTELTGNQHLATESYVGSQGFLTSVDLNGYATESYVGSQGFLTSVDLNGYATESYVTTALGDYTPTSGLDTAIAGYGYAKTADLPTMYTDADAVDAVQASLTNGLTSVTGPALEDQIGINYGSGLALGVAAGNYGQLIVDTDVIATKAYADGIASGLDIKSSVQVASTANIENLSTFDYSMTAIDGVYLNPGERVLLKNQTTPSENGIFIAQTPSGLVRSTDATFDSSTGAGTLTKGSFTFVEHGTHAGHGFVVSELSVSGGVWYNNWTQFSDSAAYITSVGDNLAVVNGLLSLGTDVVITDSTQTLSNKTLENPTLTLSYDVEGLPVSFTVDAEELSHLNGVTSPIQTQLNAKQGTLTEGTAINIFNGTVSVDVAALAGTGITYNAVDDTLEAAPAYISTVDASFSVTDGELSLSDTITIASVELTDSVANVTAASDVFGNASATAYDMGSNKTIGTLPTGAEVADVFVTLKAGTTSRTSKLTYVNTGDDAPTWTEYGIIVSGSFPATTISFDSSGNIIANVTGATTYSAKGVVTILK